MKTKQIKLQNVSFFLCCETMVTAGEWLFQTTNSHSSTGNNGLIACLKDNSALKIKTVIHTFQLGISIDIFKAVCLYFTGKTTAVPWAISHPGIATCSE